MEGDGRQPCNQSRSTESIAHLPHHGVSQAHVSSVKQAFACNLPSGGRYGEINRRCLLMRMTAYYGGSSPSTYTRVWLMTMSCQTRVGRTSQDVNVGFVKMKNVKHSIVVGDESP